MTAHCSAVLAGEFEWKRLECWVPDERNELSCSTNFNPPKNEVYSVSAATEFRFSKKAMFERLKCI